MADLVKYREKFLVRPHASVEVRVTWISPGDDPLDDNRSDQNTSRFSPWYQCLTCADRLSWENDQRFFECPSCGYQLTADEATILCDDAIRSVQALASLTRKKRGVLWRLLRLFVGRASQT